MNTLTLYGAALDCYIVNIFLDECDTLKQKINDMFFFFNIELDVNPEVIV